MVLSRGVIGEIYNVGSSAELANLSLCKLLLSAFGHSVETEAEVLQHVVFVKDRPYNDHRYAVNGDKLRELGWVQNTGFEEGLRRTVEWYRRFGETWWGDIEGALTAYSDKETVENGEEEKELEEVVPSVL